MTLRPYAEFRLGFVVSRAPQGSAGERLCGVEQALGQLIRRWRAGAPVSAARDIRLAPATRDELVAWIETGGHLDTGVMERLGVYHSGAVADPSVPSGWIRIYLDAGQRDPGGLRRRARH